MKRSSSSPPVDGSMTADVSVTGRDLSLPPPPPLLSLSPAPHVSIHFFPLARVVFYLQRAGTGIALQQRARTMQRQQRRRRRR